MIEVKEYKAENLDDSDLNFLNGYDKAIKDIDNFFLNINIFSDAFEPFLNTDIVDMDEVFDNSIHEADEEMNLNKETEIVKRLRDCMIYFLKEVKREELIENKMDTKKRA